MARRYAAADIGSNTVHLLVAELGARGALRRLVNESEWLSLGEVVSREGHIPDDHADRLVGTLRRYKRISQEFGADGVYVFATEAMRVASNHPEILQRIQRTTGITVELISPAREAELSLSGVTLDTPLEGEQVFFEVGGGSAQIAHCRGRRVLAEHSLPIGTGRLKAQFPLRQPVSAEILEELRDFLSERLREVPCPSGLDGLVASGGVARGLIRALHPDGQRQLQTYELDYLIRSVAGLEVGTIVRRFGVKQKRAATLLSGALVFREAMRRFGLDALTVSEFGVREGAILEMATQGSLA